MVPSPLRLCHIVPSLEERHGGPSQSVRALANHLAIDGDQVTLLTTCEPYDPYLPQPDDHAEIRSYWREFPSFAASAPDLKEHLQKREYDCVHHHSIWLRTLAYAAAAARARGCPLVISPRGMMSDWAWAHRRWRKQLASWFIHPGAFRQAAGWHATSHEEAQDIRRRGFTQPICMAPNGVFIPEREELEKGRRFWEDLCPSLRSRPVALFYSRLHRKKRVRELIDLWLSQPRGNWILLVIGPPEDYDPNELHCQMVEAGHRDRVIVHDGRKRPPPYGVASLFLLPSHSENFGLVIAEALAAGVPALVTDTTPWLRLGEQEAGWCVPWADYPATLIRALALGRAELAARGAHGRRWMTTDFSWGGAARTLHDFYAELRHA